MVLSDQTTTVLNLRNQMAKFVNDRNWSQFHDPKNLAMALCAEAAELLEHFLWITPEESRLASQEPKKLLDISEEISDVTCLIMALCNSLNLDLSESFLKKMAKNELKYPADLCWGKYKVDDSARLKGKS